MREPGSSWAGSKRRHPATIKPKAHLKRFRTEVTKGFRQAKIDREIRAERKREGATAKNLVKCGACGLWIVPTAAGNARHAARTGCQGLTQPGGIAGPSEGDSG